jgi:amino acid transporter
VVLRILVQFLMQHVGVIYLRKIRPEMARPFKMWLYPLPAVLALCGFGYILLERVNFARELLGAGVVIVAGAVVYGAREERARRDRRRCGG